MERKKITAPCIRKMKSRGTKIVALTAYDYPTARLLDNAGVDILLVGDSLGMVVLGYENTLPVTVEEMIHHTRAVARAKPKALVVVDMPFMSFQVDEADAIRNAGRLVKEGGAEAVKLEGGTRAAPVAQAIVRTGIPVMGHVGLTPQSVHQMGGYRVQGKDPGAQEQMVQGARALEEAGCFSIVLEGIPPRLAARITGEVRIPTIGIGAGPECGGQVLVVHDMLGVNEEFVPRFVKQYEHLGEKVRAAVSHYVDEVRSGRFPGPEHCYPEEKQAGRIRGQ